MPDENTNPNLMTNHEPENDEEKGRLTQPSRAVNLPENQSRSDDTPMSPALMPPPPQPLAQPPAEDYRYMRPEEHTQESPRYKQNTPPTQYQPQAPQRPVTAPPQQKPPVQKKRIRRTTRRGCTVGPSCLVGCFGIVGVLFVTVLMSSYLVYRSYSSQLEELLVDFDARLAAQDFGTTFVYDRNGEPIGEFADQGYREPVTIEEIPDVVIYATIALEDDSFYDNIGVDIPSILRAMRDNFTEGRIVSGASTITQQVVRNILFDPELRAEQSIQRKLDEALLAIALTQDYSKDEILEIYLNNINYGNGAYGIEAAARNYFGKSASELQLHEAALLVGIPQAPSLLNPLSPDPLQRQRILARQHLVLDLMVEEGYITREVAETAKRTPLEFVGGDSGAGGPYYAAPHFFYFTRDEVLELFRDSFEAQGYLPEDAELLAQQWFDGGLRIYTSLDLNVQSIAENAARNNVAALSSRNLTNSSVIVMNPATGEILGMVGSVDFENEAIDGQVNVSLAQRQPGSTMKIFTYSAALELGWAPSEVIWDTPVSIEIPGQPNYEPENYDRRVHGPLHLRDALANSYNIPAVQTLRFVGVPYLLDMMQRFGVQSLNRGAENYGLSLTLGGGEVTLLELTTAYGVYANGGNYVQPQAILCIISDDDDRIIYEYNNGCPEGNRTAQTRSDLPQGRTVLDPRIAFLMSDILSDNAARTPAMGANSPLNTGNLLTSVKTGTTNDYRDNWTVGYTSDIVVGVWSGNSDNSAMVNTSGLDGAAPIWRDTMQGIYSNLPLPTPSLNAPPGLYNERICDVRSLNDPASDCSGFRREWFFESLPLVPDGSGNLVTVSLPTDSQSSSEYGPLLEEVQPGIIRTWVRPLAPDQIGYLQAQHPNSAAQKYCLIPQEVLDQVSDRQQLLFAQYPPEPNDARRAFQYAANSGDAILPQFACTPETIAGGLPTVDAGRGDWEVNPTSSYPARTAAIYCKADGSIEIWEVVNSSGQPAIFVSPAQIAQVGVSSNENLLIASGGQTNVRLYRLSSGEFQVNAPLNGDPNGYVHIWGGC